VVSQKRRPLGRAYTACIEAGDADEAADIAVANATRGLGYHADVRPRDVSVARDENGRWHVHVWVVVR
jgi:hypothetical protein